MIYIHKDIIQPIRPLTSDQYDHVILYNWLCDPAKSGIPVELTTRVYDDFDQLKIKRNTEHGEKLNVLYVSPETYAEQHHLLTIISLCNALSVLSLTVLYDEQRHPGIREFANEHIRFADIKNPPDELNTAYDLVITYGPGAIHFLKENIPVIIAGPFGLGGMATTSNLHYLFKNGFAGRPGGTFGEPIPVSVLAHEIITVRDYQDIGTLLKDINQQLQAHPLIAASEINQIRSRVESAREARSQEEKRGNLKPAISSNIRFAAEGDMIALSRMYINDTLCVISREDLAFFNRINGEHTCTELCSTSSMSQDDFWETLDTLVLKKIITF